MTPVELARLFDQPAEAGRRAQTARAAHFGRRVLVRPAPQHPTPAVAALIRGGSAAVDLDDWSEAHVLEALQSLSEGTGPKAHGGAGEAGARAAGQGDPGWPDPAVLRPGDRLVVQVDRERLGAYCDYLVRLAAAAPADLSFAPVCARPGGLLRLHLTAAARIALPGRVRVEARHDLLGIRLAQVALGFGADTLSGPITPARRLPLAGVPRPDEATPAGLSALIERAGLEAVLHDLSPETSP
jgi:hypothetical protein